MLALRRYVVSSLGPAYTSIWHRDPAGRWTFYTTISPDCSCARYYGARIDRNVVAPIELAWTTPWTFHARVGRSLAWHVTLHSSLISRLFNTVTQLLPNARGACPSSFEAWAGCRRRVRHRSHTWTGRTPNGHRFNMHHRQFWLIDASTAHVFGNDLGPPGPLAAQATLEDTRLPQRALFAVTSVRFERPARGKQLPLATARRATPRQSRGANHTPPYQDDEKPSVNSQPPTPNTQKGPVRDYCAQLGVGDWELEVVITRFSAAANGNAVQQVMRGTRQCADSWQCSHTRTMSPWVWAARWRGMRAKKT